MRIALLLVLALLLAVSACGSDSGSPGNDQSPAGKPPATTTQKGGGYNYP